MQLYKVQMAVGGIFGLILINLDEFWGSQMQL